MIGNVFYLWTCNTNMLNFIKKITRFYPKRGDRKSSPHLNIGPIHWLDPNSPFEEKEKKMVCDPQNPIKQDKPRWCSIIWSQIKTLSLLEISATYFLMIQTVGTSRLDFVSFLVSYFWIHEIFWVGPHRQTCSMQILIYKLNHK